MRNTIRIAKVLETDKTTIEETSITSLGNICMKADQEDRTMGDRITSKIIKAAITKDKTSKTTIIEATSTKIKIKAATLNLEEVLNAISVEIRNIE